MYEMLKVRTKPPLHGGAAFGVAYKELMPSLRNAWNSEAYDEDKRINRKLYEKTASALAAADTSTPVPPLRLRAVLTEVSALINKILGTVSIETENIKNNNPANLSPISVDWNDLVSKVNPLVIGPVNVGMSDEDTNALHSLISNQLLQPLETLQATVATNPAVVTNADIVTSDDIAKNIVKQIQAKYYKAVPYGPEVRAGLSLRSSMAPSAASSVPVASVSPVTGTPVPGTPNPVAPPSPGLPPFSPTQALQLTQDDINAYEEWERDNVFGDIRDTNVPKEIVEKLALTQPKMTQGFKVKLQTRFRDLLPEYLAYKQSPQQQAAVAPQAGPAAQAQSGPAASPQAQKHWTWRELKQDKKIEIILKVLNDPANKDLAQFLKKYSQRVAQDPNFAFDQQNMDALEVLAQKIKERYPNAVFEPKKGQRFSSADLMPIFLDPNQQKLRNEGYGKKSTLRGGWTDYSGPMPQSQQTPKKKSLRGGNYRDTPMSHTGRQTRAPTIDHRQSVMDFDDEGNDPNELGGIAKRNEMLQTENKEVHLDPDWKGLPKRLGAENRLKKMRKGYVNPRESYF